MGRAAAIAYAREGADVVISYYPTEEPDAREVIQLINAEGRKGILLPGDLREENYCQELVAKAVAALGSLDIVVSNAGRQQQCEDILKLTTENFDWTMKTNLYAPFWIIKAALPTCSRARALSPLPRGRRTIRRPTFMTMRRPRPQP
jgi:NAD(P)-dependent dehydrogenase (short-subunit alcohol dehydrogenase family)